MLIATFTNADDGLQARIETAGKLLKVSLVDLDVEKWHGTEYKLGWHGKWFGGDMPGSGTGMVFVWTGLASHPDFKVSRKPENGWKPEEIADYDTAMAR